MVHGMGGSSTNAGFKCWWGLVCPYGSNTLPFDYYDRCYSNLSTILTPPRFLWVISFAKPRRYSSWDRLLQVSNHQGPSEGHIYKPIIVLMVRSHLKRLSFDLVLCSIISHTRSTLFGMIVKKIHLPATMHPTWRHIPIRLLLFAGMMLSAFSHPRMSMQEWLCGKIGSWT